MNQQMNVTWVKDMKFSALINGHEIILDASAESGGSDEGPRPKFLLMAALAGCTGMDVISILKKMRIEPDYFNLKIEAVIRDEHPKKFEAMKTIYEFKGQNLPFESLEKAVKLSIDKYCGVNANFRDSMKLDYEIVILP